MFKTSSDLRDLIYHLKSTQRTNRAPVLVLGHGVSQLVKPPTLEEVANKILANLDDPLAIASDDPVRDLRTKWQGLDSLERQIMLRMAYRSLPIAAPFFDAVELLKDGIFRYAVDTEMNSLPERAFEAEGYILGRDFISYLPEDLSDLPVGNTTQAKAIFSVTSAMRETNDLQPEPGQIDSFWRATQLPAGELPATVDYVILGGNSEAEQFAAWLQAPAGRIWWIDTILPENDTWTQWKQDHNVVTIHGESQSLEDYFSILCFGLKVFPPYGRFSLDTKGFLAGLEQGEDIESHLQAFQSRVHELRHRMLHSHSKFQMTESIEQTQQIKYEDAKVKEFRSRR